MAEQEPGHHHHHHHEWTEEHLRHLEHPDREQWMPRAPVLEAVDARPGDKVADVGAGLGWLTFPLAMAVGASGRVLAIDPSPDAVRALRERSQADHLAQVEVIQARAESTHLPADYVDRVVWHTMYHDVEGRQSAIDEMFRIMKSGARWVVVDWVKDESVNGPPIAIRMHPEEVAGEITAHGFIQVGSFTPGPVTWGLIFEKP